MMGDQPRRTPEDVRRGKELVRTFEVVRIVRDAKRRRVGCGLDGKELARCRAACLDLAADSRLHADAIEAGRSTVYRSPVFAGHFRRTALRWELYAEAIEAALIKTN